MKVLLVSVPVEQITVLVSVNYIMVFLKPSVYGVELTLGGNRRNMLMSLSGYSIESFACEEALGDKRLDPEVDKALEHFGGL